MGQFVTGVPSLKLLREHKLFPQASRKALYRFVEKGMERYPEPAATTKRTREDVGGADTMIVLASSETCHLVPSGRVTLDSFHPWRTEQRVGFEGEYALSRTAPNEEHGRNEQYNLV
ncbi:hypothetical protein JX266_005253 [Neoarthrinium moseri]|nr:hypothetical protein JX266_005253 [Neoarthrinium moseri]